MFFMLFTWLLFLVFLIWFGIFLVWHIGRMILKLSFTGLNSWILDDPRPDNYKIRNIRYIADTGETFIYDSSLICGTPEHREQLDNLITFKKRHGCQF